MKTKYFQQKVNQLNRSSVQPSILLGDFLELSIDLPPRPIQDKIASILSEIDNQIERNNAIAKRLQLMNRTIYSAMFKGCNKKVSLLNTQYANIVPTGITQFNGKKCYIATADVDKENINLNAKLISYNSREDRANMQPTIYSVWFARMKNSAKHIFIPANANKLTNDYIFSTGFCGLQCDEETFEFVAESISLPSFEKQKDKIAHGATMEAVNNDDLISLFIPDATISDIQKYHARTQKMYEQVFAINEENYKLSQLKNVLLPLLINGQLTVDE